MKNLILVFVICLSVFNLNNVFAQSENCISQQNEFQVYIVGETYELCSSIQAQCANCFLWTVTGAAQIIGDPTTECIAIEIVENGLFTVDLVVFRNGECLDCSITSGTIETPNCCTPEVVGVHDCIQPEDCGGRGWLQIYPNDCEKFEGLTGIELHWVPSTSDITEDLAFTWVDGIVGANGHTTFTTPSLTNDEYFQVNFCTNACIGDMIEIHLYYNFEDPACDYIEIYQFESYCNCDFNEGRLIDTSVYPNPIQNNVNINTTFIFSEKDVNVTLIDLNSGRVVTSKNYNEISAGQFNDSFEIPTTTINGLYILSVTSKNELLHTEIIQQANF